MDREEHNLIARGQAGDRWAFEQLVSRYDRQILALAHNMVGDREEAQDIYQEALLAAFRGLPRFRLESDFFTWLYRIAVNEALKWRKRRKRRKRRRETQWPEEEWQVDNPEKKILNAELGARIMESLDGLSPQERMAFALCHDQGYKLGQAALYMDCSVGSVKSYLFRARNKMKKDLRTYMEG